MAITYQSGQRVAVIGRTYTCPRPGCGRANPIPTSGPWVCTCGHRV